MSTPSTVPGREPDPAPRPTTVELSLLGSRVSVSIEGAGAATFEASMTRAWDRCLADPPLEPATETVRVAFEDDPEAMLAAHGSGALADTDETGLMDTVATRLNHLALETQVGSMLLLHACAVADPATGATVVLVAPSGTGKTTASITLGRHFGYLSDEIAAINLDGSMVAFPKPLSVLIDGTRPKRQVSPGELGLLEAPAAPWLAGMGLLQRVPEPTPVRVESVPMLEALPPLAEQSSSLHLLERPLHLVAELLTRTGGLRRLTYHESEDLIPFVGDLMERAR